MGKVYSLFTVIAVFFSFSLKAQTGTEFWFAPPEVTSGHVTDNPIVLRMATGNTAATVTIEQPANAALFNGGAPIVVNIPANSATTVDLSADLANLETAPSDVVLTTGLHVSSTSSITCYYEINTGFNPDIYALKGANSLGREFYTPFQTAWANGNYTPTAYTSFDIVATEDNTTVFIYPRVPLDGGHPALSSYSIVLQRGETYSGSVTGGTGADNPAGTIIVSDKDIAVSIKDDSVNPAPAGCRDLIGDQLVPTDIVGDEYIVSLGGLTVPERCYVTATANGTDVFVAGVYETTLFNGETYEIDLTAAQTYINTSQPVYLLHISGFGCEVGGAILPPLNCAGSEEVNFVRSTTEFFGLNVLVPAGAEGDFLVNGNTTLIQATDFAVVPGTGGAWLGAQVSFNTTDVPINVNNLITNNTDVFAVGLINGGASSGCRFGYFSEFASEIIVDAGADQIVCSNDSVDLTGSVTGGATTGQWSSTGTGIFLPDDQSLTATYVPSFTDLATGTVVLTLESTGQCFPVSDNMTVSFTPGPTVNAGADQSACGNNPVVTLGGSVTIATGGVWSGGAGTFSPSNTDLNATYTPTAAEVSAGTLTLTLTTTGNGTCNPETDDMDITFGPAPTANAGTDQTVCANNADVNLSGAVTIATGGAWSGGGGTFTPNNTDLNAVYTPSAAEITAGTVTLTLTTTGNGGCTAVTDDVTITITAAPTVNAGPDQVLCENNADATLAGSVTIATGGQWTGGLGIFNPNNNDLNAVYTPTAGELTAGSVTLTLTSTGNGTCLAVTDDVTISFTTAPTADAGTDQTVCGNNPNVTLAGGVTIATGGTWSGGTGAFTPNNTDLNAVYTPSAAEIAAGTVTLTLTTTGNGTCNAATDDVVITITPAPTADAGIDQTLCANNPDVTLNGLVTVASGGSWSGGAGTFTPSNTALNAMYTPTAAEIASGSVTLTLTTTGNGTCNAVSDNIQINFTLSPTVNAGVDQSLCANNSDVSLSGSVSIATGGQWTGGLGTFTPSNTDLNATYTPTLGEIASGSVTLTLTSTGNGNCIAVTDDVNITFTTAPTADAGTDISVCANNADATLAGAITIATGGIWSGGAGTFSPNNTTLTATYTPTPAEIAAGSVTLTLTTFGNGNCNPATDDVIITIDPSPVADAGVDQSVCENNADVTLAGSTTGAAGGVWSGGAGSFAPGNTTLNAVYTPTAGEIASGSVTLTLTTTGNGLCNAESDNMTITFTTAPTANAGTDQTLCANNADISLSGSVTVATGGQWSGGLGTFTPSNTDLNAVYTPTVGEIASGSLTLTLTTTGNGTCLPVTDDVDITFTASPTVDAGVDQAVCENNAAVSLSGAITIATGAQWSGGAGSFAPNSNDLNATYTPTAAEIASGSVRLYLTTTGNGTCNAEVDSMDITFTPAPIAAAGSDITACANNAAVVLNGSVTGATGGQWSGGAGTFNPSNTDLNATYTPSVAEIAAGTVTLTLTTTGNGTCNAETDDVTITITPAPAVNAGVDVTLCENNADVALNGSVTNAGGGQWTGGLGVFTPSNSDLNAVYTPTVGEIASGSLTLTLTSTGNGSCNAETDDIIITFTAAPTVDAGADQTLCSNSPNVSLAGTVVGATGGQWSGGSGAFTPNILDLNASYTPTPAEIAAGTLTLYLTSTGNGNCLAVVDSLELTFAPEPTADAGNNQTSCENNPDVALAGVVTNASGGVWSGGTGSFNPANTALGAVYTPSAAEIAAGTVRLYLTTTGNGNCNAVVDSMDITIGPAPIVNAGPDLTACGNNADVNLAGSVTGATGGQWSGGLGVFNPSSTDLNATYSPAASEVTNGSVTLTLTSTGNGTCLAVTDDVIITYTPAPTVNAGIDQSVCANNVNITLDGSFAGAGGAVWSGGLGTYAPSNTDMNAVYTPTAAEIAAGTLTLTLTTTGNGTCNAETDDVLITITPSPVVNAGADQTVCVTDLDIQLGGLVSGVTTTGAWSTTGTGFFVPTNTDLNAIYQASSQDSINGSVVLVLTSTSNGNCNAVTDSMTVSILPAGTANAGPDQIVCGNNANINLSGSLGGNASNGIWSSSGSGTFTPNATDLNAMYIPSASDVAAGTVTITLNATSCNAATDDMVLTITSQPVVDAGLDTIVCVTDLNVPLNGTVSGASSTGQWTTLGTGFFSPNDTDLNATYQVSSQDSINQSVTLVLAATNIGSCTPVSDTVVINIFPGGTSTAGPDQSVCANNATITLNGTVGGGATEGQWSTSGTGTFSPADTVLNADYIPSAADTAAGTVTLTLTATNSCNQATDDLTLTITPAPFVDAGTDITICGTNPVVNLSGTISGITTTGTWTTTGTGAFSPSANDLNAVYTASAADLAAGSFWLHLTSTNNNNCNPVVDSIQVQITTGILVNAGPDQVVCSSADSTQLQGLVTNGTTTGQWTTLGSGNFWPNDSTLNGWYSFSTADTTAGSVDLVLTSTNNGSCAAESDTVTITFGNSSFVNAGTDLSICASEDSVALNGFVTGGAVDGIWTTTGTGTFSPADTILNAHYLPSSADSTFGTVSLILTSTNNGGCLAATDTLQLSILPIPSANAGPDQTICSSSDSVNMAGSMTNAFSGMWTTLGTGTFSPSDTIMNPVYFPTVADSLLGGVNIVYTVTGAGVCPTASDTMFLSFAGGNTADAGPDQTVCADNLTIALSGSVNGAQGGIWSTGGSGTFTPSDTLLNASYVASSADSIIGSVDLVLTTTGNGGCPAGSDTVTITFDPVPLADAGADVFVCVGTDSVPLTGGVGGAQGGQWTSNGSGSFTPSDTDLNATYVLSAADMSLDSIMIIMTTTGNGICAADADTMYIVQDDPLAAGFTGADACAGDFVTFTDTSLVFSGSIVAWDWNFGDNTPNSTLQNPTHQYITEGVYDVTLIVTSDLGCTDTATGQVVVSGFPTAGFSANPNPAQAEEAVQFTNTSLNATTYSWDFGDNSGTSTDQDPQYTYIAPGTYIVSLVASNDFGCSDTATVSIFVDDQIVYPPKAPTGFTPNGDGQNEVFYVRGGPFDVLEFKVYNGWGEVIFETSDPEQGWDGTHNGKKVPNGVYVYTVKATTVDGAEYSKSGKVTLLR